MPSMWGEGEKGQAKCFKRKQKILFLLQGVQGGGGGGSWMHVGKVSTDFIPACELSFKRSALI